ncbi:MAG: hypothetical protein GWO88_00580 [Planctomycetia bacterium]|nr:hypothetical protein [Planctomycetia bacterium]
MIKLTKDLKRALAALANQDAGDYLSMHDKMKVIGYGSNPDEKSFNAPRLVSNRHVKKRIALISDGSGRGTALEYAIDACKRHDAEIDLLLHDNFDVAAISVMENQISESGLYSQRILLGANGIEKIIKYASRLPSLIFMLGMSDDSIVKVLMEEIIPGRDQRFPVPLVLIDERKSSDAGKQSAA